MTTSRRISSRYRDRRKAASWPRGSGRLPRVRFPPIPASTSGRSRTALSRSVNVGPPASFVIAADDRHDLFPDIRRQAVPRCDNVATSLSIQSASSTSDWEKRNQGPGRRRQAERPRPPGRDGEEGEGRPARRRRQRGDHRAASPSTATPEHYDKTYNIIARGTFFTIQKAVPLMTAGGSIVTVGSVAYKKPTL
jgi:NAD(P)-dependent dehydrogenase (short-subunit alcohol dehydrogenase family)